MSSTLIALSLLGVMAAAENRPPVLINTCLITNDVPRLVGFYREVLRIPAKTSGADYAEFHTGAGVLAVFSASAQQRAALRDSCCHCRQARLTTRITSGGSNGMPRTS